MRCESRAATALHIVHVCERAIALYRLSATHVEQDADVIADCCQELVSEIILWARLHGQNIRSAALAIQRSTVVAWRQGQRALAPAVSWQDARTAARIAPLAADTALCTAIKKISGLVLSAHYGASKISLLQQQYRAAMAVGATDCVRVAPLASYILQRIVQGEPFVVDETNAARTLLYDIHTRQWSAQLAQYFAVNRAQLPKVVPSCGYFGVLMNSDIPVTVVVGDQNAAFHYLANVAPAARRDTQWPVQNNPYIGANPVINCGTGAFILQLLPTASELDVADKTPDGALAQGLLTTLLNSDVNGTSFALEATINGAGAAMTVLEKDFHPLLRWTGESAFYQQVERACANGVCKHWLFLNSIGGLASPFWRNDIPARYYLAGSQHTEFTAVDLSDKTIAQWPNACLAVVESIAFLLVVNLTVMAGATLTPNNTLGRHMPVVIAGGLSRCDYLCWCLSALLKCPVHRVENTQATVLGAAYLAINHAPRFSDTMLDRDVTDLNRLMNPTSVDAIEIFDDAVAPSNRYRHNLLTLAQRYQQFQHLLAAYGLDLGG